MNRSTYILLASMSLPLIAQDQGKVKEEKKEPPPGLIRLLPGYEYTSDRDYDVRYGTISKKDGLTIHYSQGFVEDGAEKAKAGGDVVWSKEQDLDYAHVQMVMSKNHALHVTFTKGLVSGRTNLDCTVDTIDEMSDFMLMALTFGSRPVMDKK